MTNATCNKCGKHTTKDNIVNINLHDGSKTNDICVPCWVKILRQEPEK